MVEGGNTLSRNTHPHPHPLTLEDTLPKYGVEEDEIASKFVKHGTILHLEHCK